jgi:hypothetical protein
MLDPTSATVFSSRCRVESLRTDSALIMLQWLCYNIYFFTIATTQPPLYGADSGTMRPPWRVLLILR